MATVLKAKISEASAPLEQFSTLTKIGAPATGEYTSTAIVISVAVKGIGEAKQAGSSPTVTPAQQSVPGGFVILSTELLGSVGSAPITALV